jgi:hypothetical protein
MLSPLCVPDEYNKTALPAIGTKPPQRIATLLLAWAARAALRCLSAAALYNRNGSDASTVQTEPQSFPV